MKKACVQKNVFVPSLRFLKLSTGDIAMAQWVKVLTDNCPPEWISQNSQGGRRESLLQVVCQPPHMCCAACQHTHTKDGVICVLALPATVCHESPL